MALSVACLLFATIPQTAFAGWGGPHGYSSGSRHGHHIRAGSRKLAVGYRSRHLQGRHKGYEYGHHYGGKHKVGYFKHYRYRTGGSYVRYDPPPRATYEPSAYQPPSQPAASKPFSPKWIHVGTSDIDNGFAEEAAPHEEGKPLTNCLAVRTEITVDGVPMDAYGRACLKADGSWRLEPVEPDS
jgi:hypothetical protein